MEEEIKKLFNSCSRVHSVLGAFNSIIIYYEWELLTADKAWEMYHEIENKYFPRFFHPDVDFLVMRNMFCIAIGALDNNDLEGKFINVMMCNFEEE